MPKVIIYLFEMNIIQTYTDKKTLKSKKNTVAWRLGCQTYDQAVVGSIPGRAAIKLPRSTQPSIPLR